MNTKKYSAMPQEKEVLLTDGTEFKIVDVITDFEVKDRASNKHKITKIVLKYDNYDW